MKVGFIGLGQMGGSMALHIRKAGHDVLVHDIRREACEAAIEAGAEYAANPAEAAKRSEAIVICVPWPGPQEEVMMGSDGVFAGAHEGHLVIDQTVMPPRENWKLAGRCAAEGMDYIDAPVTVSRVGAANGTLGVMVGGDEAAFQRAVPVIECFASKVRHVGPVGHGNTLKLLNQCIYVSFQAAFAEGLALGEDLGFSLDTMLDMFESTSAGHPSIIRRYGVIRGTEDGPAFLIQRGRMFLEHALEANENPKHVTPVVDTVIKSLRRAEELGLGDKDVMAARNGYLKR